MTKRTSPTTQFQGFPGGIDNRAASYAMPDGFCRDAVNVDIRTSGKIKRRSGYTKLLSGTTPHSLFANSDVVLYVEDGGLKKLNSDNSVDVLFSSWGDVRTTYVDLGGEVFFSNGLRTGRWKNGLYNWGAPTPYKQPFAEAVSTGGMHTGTYQVAITWRDIAGIESSTQLATTVYVAEGGGIELTDFPTPPVTIETVSVYISSNNGKELYLYGDFPAHHTFALNIQQRTLSVPLATAFCITMPTVDQLTIQGGRIYGAKGNVLYRTRPYNPYLVDGMDNMTFESDIKAVVGMYDGLYVVTEKRGYFLTDLENGKAPQRTDVVFHGAVPGCVTVDPVNPGGFWLGNKGLIKAMPQGQVENMTGKHVAMPFAEEGTMVVREIDGERYVLISTWGCVPNPLVSTDWATT